MAGATAFFTTFALPPIVFLLAQLFGLFAGSARVGLGLIENISNNLGSDGAQQITDVIISIRGFSNNWYVIVLGSLFLFFVATTLFIVIKNSLNQIWNITVKEKPGLLFNLSIRLRSFAVICMVGILFFADLIFKSIEIIAGNYLDKIFETSNLFFRIIFGEITSVIIVAAWFIILFRFLADGKPAWKAAFIGGLFTGILFSAGRMLLRTLLVDSNIGELYGAGGAFVLILLFVFYTSFILYYGACFILIYSHNKQWPVQPNNKAFITEDVQ